MTVSSVARLAQFFPGAMAVRIPVRVVGAVATSSNGEESTVIEYGTPREVLFASGLPLEFGDRLRLVNADGSFDADGTVVAIHYQDGCKAVAVRFVRELPNWIIKA
jgi:hypothetical protein